MRAGVIATALASAWLLLDACAAADGDRRFTIAVVPDTQNYVDYTHQRAAGFPFDARDLFFEQMAYLAANVESAGGDIAFVTAVGDLWQHQTQWIDPAHEARGSKREPNAFWDPIVAPTLKTLTEEIPTVLEGYRMIAGKVPFSVVPGNHDFDATWTSVRQSSSAGLDVSNAGTLHVGGLYNFINAFSEESEFFRNQAWYVGSHDHGADSAQLFTAGGYRFLHIGLQFDPPDASMAWAASMLRQHPGVPTIVTTHNYLDVNGGREPHVIVDNHVADPLANTPEMVWDELISRHDQIFMVLCGHRQQARSVDRNQHGHSVHQLMSNYQGRGQTATAAGLDDVQIGDGWLRLMTFDLGARTPTVRVRTYSTRYKKFSRDVAEYAAWYKARESPHLSDADFHAGDDFAIELTDFRERFGAPSDAR